MIEPKTSEELLCNLRPNSSGCDGNELPVLLPSPEGPQTGNDLPDIDPLPGCELGDELCDLISDIPGDQDEAWKEEEEVAGGIINALLDGLRNEGIDLPLSFDYGQLARLVGSGLAPRTVDAAGRGLALHNNLLVDALFERQPLRQFKPLTVNDEVVPEVEVGLERT